MSARARFSSNQTSHSQSHVVKSPESSPNLISKPTANPAISHAATLNPTRLSQQNLKTLAKEFLALAKQPKDLVAKLEDLVDSARNLMPESSVDSGGDSGVLIVGLGNPGEKYARTRHNIGFMVLDRLCETLGGSWETAPKFHTELATLPSPNARLSAPTRCYLLKPQTFMNLSGESVGAFARFYKISRILVIHDELDIPFGALRYKLGGSSGGHNGLKSIDAHIGDYLGGNGYARLRFGIGDPSLRKPYDVAGFVLGDFLPAQRDELCTLITHAMFGALFFACTQDFTATQNFFTKAPTPSNTPESSQIAMPKSARKDS